MKEGHCTALLRYQPGASIPEHYHAGDEHILVLQGSQFDGTTTLSAGTMLYSSRGTSHEITSEHGCIVLAIWEQPVVFGPAS